MISLPRPTVDRTKTRKLTPSFSRLIPRFYDRLNYLRSFRPFQLPTKCFKCFRLCSLIPRVTAVRANARTRGASMPFYRWNGMKGNRRLLSQGKCPAIFVPTRGSKELSCSPNHSHASKALKNLSFKHDLGWHASATHSLTHAPRVCLECRLSELPLNELLIIRIVVECAE